MNRQPANIVPPDIREILDRCGAAFGPWESTDDPVDVLADIQLGSPEEYQTLRKACKDRPALVEYVRLYVAK